MPSTNPPYCQRSFVSLTNPTIQSFDRVVVSFSGVGILRYRLGFVNRNFLLLTFHHSARFPSLLHRRFPLAVVLPQLSAFRTAPTSTLARIAFALRRVRFRQGGRMIQIFASDARPIFENLKFHFPVEVKGLEPMTLCLQSRCSPN